MTVRAQQIVFKVTMNQSIDSDNQNDIENWLWYP